MIITVYLDWCRDKDSREGKMFYERRDVKSEGLILDDHT